MAKFFTSTEADNLVENNTVYEFPIASNDPESRTHVVEFDDKFYMITYGIDYDTNTYFFDGEHPEAILVDNAWKEVR